MHEYAISQHLLDVTLERAEAAQAQRIRAITVRLGRFSGIVEDSLRFYLELLTPQTLADGAALQVEWVAGRLRCHTCQYQYEPEGTLWFCPKCGGMGGEVLSGRECYLQSIEIETEGYRDDTKGSDG